MATARPEEDVKINYRLTIQGLIEQLKRYGAEVILEEWCPTSDEEASKMISELFPLMEEAKKEFQEAKRSEPPSAFQLRHTAVTEAIKRGTIIDTLGAASDCIDKWQKDRKGSGPGDRTKKQVR